MYAEFIENEMGAQIIEYSLMIAAVSIGLVLALQHTALGASFQDFISSLVTCFSSVPCA